MCGSCDEFRACAISSLGAEPALSGPGNSEVSIRYSTNTRLALSGVERLATSCRFNEGPVYFGDARCLLWSDIPNSRIMRWDEETGATSVYRSPRTTPTATPATARAASSPASMAGA